MIWVMLGALGVYITNDFGLSASQLGLIVAIPILTGSVFRIVMGVLTDRFYLKNQHRWNDCNDDSLALGMATWHVHC